MGEKLKILTFGDFQISAGDVIYSGAAGKRNKVRSVLKYLIAYYGKPVSADRLASSLWPDEECADPAKLLRDIIYRLRKSLADCFGEQKYVLFSHGNYLWNTDIDCDIDFLEFDRLLDLARDGSKPYNERVALYNAAIDLYKGPFFKDSVIELWTLNTKDYYRRRYVQAMGELADLYEMRALLDEIVIMYGKAITYEPYEEPLYIRQIHTLIKTGEYGHARQQYRVFEKLMRELDAEPSQDFERLSVEIDKAAKIRSGSLDEIMQSFDLRNKRKGAFFCGLETFQQIYIFDKRSEERVYYPGYLALLTFSVSEDIEERSRERELKAAMKTLRQVLVQALRRGDLISQCSKNQFIIRLTVMTEDGGPTAVRRVKYLFESKYGKEKGTLDYSAVPIGKEPRQLNFGEGDMRAPLK